MARDYNQLAKDIVRLVGTEENVISLTHCITRLRFKLKDESKADKDAISQLNGVISVLQAGGQYQVVIGNHVTDVYDAIGKVTNVSLSGSVDADDDAPKGSFVNVLIDTLSGIFMPMMVGMSAAGLLKAFLVMFSSLGWMAEDSSTYMTLYALGDGVFQFMPIFLAYTAATKFKCNPWIAMAVAAGLCHGNLASLPEAKLFGIPFIMITYTSSVIPIVVATFFQSKFEKLVKKVIPPLIAGIFVPVIVAFVTFVLTLFIVGPITSIVGSAIATALVWVLDFAPPVAGFLIACFWPCLIIFGMHWGFIPIIINNIQTMGYDVILPITVGSNFAIGAACLAVFLKTRDKDLKQTAGAASVSALLGGITEPGIYGVTLKYKKPFIITCISCGVCGIIAAMSHLTQPVLLNTCLITIPVIGTTVGWMDVVALTVAAILTFVGTLTIGYNDDMILKKK